jgi:hypothetical protein
MRRHCCIKSANLYLVKRRQIIHLIEVNSLSTVNCSLVNISTGSFLVRYMYTYNNIYGLPEKPRPPPSPTFQPNYLHPDILSWSVEARGSASPILLCMYVDICMLKESPLAKFLAPALPKCLTRDCDTRFSSYGVLRS